ncbi:MAG: hypothetical protein R3F08_17940 [Dokdonella sp.]
MIRQSGTPSTRHPAFAALAARYRAAILSFYRQRLPGNDAEDATQSFLADSFEHAWWARARPELGSFRGFLLLLLRRDLARRMGERNGPMTTQDLPDTLADLAPDAAQAFDARYVLILTQSALDRLRMEYAGRGRAHDFDRMLELLHSRPTQGGIAQAAADLDVNPNTLTVNLKRLRQRLQESLRHALRELCADEASFDREWRELQSILHG